MDKFINTFTGGLDLFHDDIRWNDTSYRSAFFGILKAYNIGTNENFIVSGCEPTLVTGVNVVITAGYIFLNGELLEVEAQTIVDGGTLDLYTYVKAITYNSGGDRVLKTTPSTVQTWQKNRGIVTASTSPVLTTELDVINGDRLQDKIEQLLGFVTDTWHEVGAAGEPVYGVGWAAYTGESSEPLKFRLSKLGVLELTGLANSSSNLTIIFTLPVGYRPLNLIRIGISGYSSANSEMKNYRLHITTNGQVVLYNPVPDTVTDPLIFNHSIPLDV